MPELKLFGSQGFGATSTREIAASGQGQYRFDRLSFRRQGRAACACADYIVETIQSIAGPALAEAATSTKDAESAQARLSVAIERMVSFLVASPEAGDIAQFVMRELSQPSAALDRIYAGVFEPTHRQLCQIWQQASGEDADSEAAKITVFTLVGQIVYFRIAREAVMRRLGWAGIGPKEAEPRLPTSSKAISTRS